MEDGAPTKLRQNCFVPSDDGFEHWPCDTLLRQSARPFDIKEVKDSFPGWFPAGLDCLLAAAYGYWSSLLTSYGIPSEWLSSRHGHYKVLMKVANVLQMS